MSMTSCSLPTFRSASISGDFPAALLSKRKRDCSYSESEESNGSSPNTMDEQGAGYIRPLTPVGNTQAYAYRNNSLSQQRVMRELFKVQTGNPPYANFSGWNDSSLWDTILQSMKLWNGDMPDLSAVLQIVLDCYDIYRTSPQNLHGILAAHAQSLFGAARPLKILTIKQMLNDLTQSGSSKRKKTYHEDSHVDVDSPSAVTNIHGCGGELENHNSNSSEGSIVNQALTIAMRGQRQSGHGLVSLWAGKLLKLLKLKLINDEQMVAAYKIFDSDNHSAIQLFLQAGDLDTEVRMVQMIIDCQTKQ